MSRTALRAALAAYATRYPEEAATILRFLALLDGRPDCFERTCWTPGHVTGSAWLLDRAGERVLLTHHRKLGRWLQLGGHADGDDDVLRVAVREATEESGLDVVPVSPHVFDVDIHEIPARKSDPVHCHFDVRFVLRVTGSDAFRISAESHDLRWIPIERLDTITDEESILRMARKWPRFASLTSTE